MPKLHKLTVFILIVETNTLLGLSWAFLTFSHPTKIHVAAFIKQKGATVLQTQLNFEHKGVVQSEVIRKKSQAMGDSPCKSQKFSLFWGSGSTPCWRVMICLEEKNLTQYDGKQLSFLNYEHKSEDVREINPRGQVGWKRSVHLLHACSFISFSSEI